MKAVLVFLFLLAFVTCETVEEAKERLLKNPQEIQDILDNCILNSEVASEELKNRVVKNKDRKPGMKLPLIPNDKRKITISDREVVRKCRNKQFSYIRRQFRKATKSS